jgi:1-phosphofructokinase family hexose kinase
MILVVGLSAVWQRTLFFNEVRLGEVNRATRVLETAAGKGVNVARVATILGLPARVLTVAGGPRGELFRRALKADGVSARIVPVGGETRLCQTLVAGDAVTEVVEEAAALRPAEVRAVLAAFGEELRRATMLVLSGTVPCGCGDDFCERLATAAGERGVPVVVDTQRAQLLGVVRHGPVLVKINQAELAMATGLGGVVRGVQELRRLGATRVVISHGAKPARAFDGRERWAVHPPRVAAVNPIGSGDAMLAGIIAGMVRGENLREALRLGVACGAANALTETSGVIRSVDVGRLLREV